jgi:hypothetical protein
MSSSWRRIASSSPAPDAARNLCGPDRAAASGLELQHRQ